MRFEGLELSRVQKVLMGRVAARAILGKGCKSTELEVQNSHNWVWR